MERRRNRRDAAKAGGDYSRARRRGVSTPSVLNVSSQKKSSREKILSPVFTEFCEHRLLGLSRRYVNSAIAKYRTVGSRWCPITNSCCRQIMSLGRLHPPLDGSPTCLDESFLSFCILARLVFTSANIFLLVGVARLLSEQTCARSPH